MASSLNIVLQFTYLMHSYELTRVNAFVVFLVATLITLEQDVKIAPTVAVLRIRFSVKWVRGSAQRRPTSVMDK